MLMLVKDMYKYYRKGIEKELDALDKRLEKILKAKTYAYAVLYKNKDNFVGKTYTFIDVTIAMDSPDKCMFEEVMMVTIDKTKHPNLIKTYLKIFYRCVIREVTLLDNIRKVKDAIMPLYVYNAIIKKTNFSLAAAILKGYMYQFGLGVYTLSVLHKPQDNHLNIDWKRSNMNKQKLIDDGKIVKSKDNPDGENWHVYRNNPFNCWWKWDKAYATIRNKALYSFKPTRSFYVEDYTKEEFGTRGETVEEIVNLKGVGNIEKLQALLRRDKMYFLTFKRHEL